MRFLLAVSIFAFVLGGTATASAEEPSSAISFGDRFFRGTSPGELAPAKVLLVSSFYAASLATITVGTANLIRASHQGEDADAYKLNQAPGFCSDLASETCTTYTGLLATEQRTRTSGYALFAAGGLAALAGALTAELWPNDAGPAQIALTFDRTSAGLRAFGKF